MGAVQPCYEDCRSWPGCMSWFWCDQREGCIDSNGRLLPFKATMHHPCCVCPRCCQVGTVPFNLSAIAYSKYPL